MSNWRTKAKEIQAAGEAERGNFTPQGVPARIYRWWLDNSESKKAWAIRHGDRRENFCHFWRVVAIWAPLMWLVTKVVDFADRFLANRVFGVTLAVVTAVILAVVFTVTGTWLDLLMVLGVMVGIVATAVGIVFGVKFLHDKFWNPRWNDIAAKIIFGLAGLIAAGVFVFVIVMLTIKMGLIFLPAFAAAIGVVALIIYGLSKWSTYLSGKRALADEARRKAANEAWNAYYNGTGPNPYHTEPRVPGKWEKRISNFFRGLGDFLILASQIVRVKKWKICPFVEVPEAN